MLFFATGACRLTLASDPTEAAAERPGLGERDVSDIRDLPFLARVPVVPASRSEMLSELAEELDREVPADEWRRAETAWRSLGLLRDDTNLREAYVAFMDDQVAGYYDPVTERLVVRDEEPEGQREVVIHELAHALADQHFDLEKLHAAVGDNDDAAAALKALIEGDATYVMFSFALGGLEFDRLPGSRRRMRRMVESMEYDGDLAGMMPIIRDAAMFSYLDGLRFVTEGRARGGWDAVNAAWASPPVSTEQIIHPERYYDRYDEPTEVELPDLSRTLGRGWRKDAANTLGELGIRLLFSTLLPDDTRGNDYADGWDGDQYASYVRTDGQSCLAWETVWDNEREAEEFSRGMARALKRHPRETRLRRDGSTVFLLVDVDPDLLPEIDARLDARDR